MEHEPRGLLGHVQRPCNLTTRNTILAVVNQPHGREPLIQPDGAVFEDRINLDGELASWMPNTTLPAQLILEEAYRGTAASWANNAVLPLGASGHEVVQAVLLVRKIPDCFQESLGFVGAFQTFMIP